MPLVSAHSNFIEESIDDREVVVYFHCATELSIKSRDIVGDVDMPT